ncbi:electron transfer flavoprotein subunit beta/FixA family protein [Candidatus Aerophobetes bacterium]|nr:electron transfer flavoprotein subunit beta/FixA family protein [Candidatus Aerophobetes bacterium]
MHIVVCIKQVPDTEELAKVKINPATNTIVREGIKSIINPFDENAIEEALRIKEKKGARVTCISMGPPQAEEALRKALAMGVDSAILISDPLFAGSDTLATSYILSQAIKKLGTFHLIITGKQAIDGDTAQVGPGIAEWLGIPQITYVRKLEVENGFIRAERTLEDCFEVVETKLPALVTVTKEINQPRYPSLKGLLQAKKMEIPVWDNSKLNLPPQRVGLEGSPTRVIKVFVPQPPPKGRIIEGSIEEKVNTIIEEMKKRNLLKWLR